MSAPGPAGGDDMAFKDFAVKHRAGDLVEVIEAAAAFSAMETGDPMLSRARLLALAAEVDDAFDRESGLRAFGQLLRGGTIRKAEGGTFTLSETSRFASASQRKVG